MPPEEIRKREEVDTQEGWDKLGLAGLPVLARRLDNLCYPDNRNCPVEEIQLCRRIVEGKKESTNNYAAYLQYVLLFATGTPPIQNQINETAVAHFLSSEAGQHFLSTEEGQHALQEALEKMNTGKRKSTEMAANANCKNDGANDDESDEVKEPASKKHCSM